MKAGNRERTAGADAHQTGLPLTEMHWVLGTLHIIGGLDSCLSTAAAVDPAACWRGPPRLLDTVIHP